MRGDREHPGRAVLDFGQFREACCAEAFREGRGGGGSGDRNQLWMVSQDLLR